MAGTASKMDPISRLPLPLLGSEPIPSAPNRLDPPGSSIDWIPDFAGYAWVAYGASSLLVISHFPSPLSPNETKFGPIFRQVLELSGDHLSAVNAVSWSPVLPSEGELAAAAGNRIWVFSHDLGASRGSFCWRQNSVLVQSLKVEAIQWTGAGDGIIACGVEVVLWKNTNKSWEIAWKFKPDVLQTLVSASWSTEGPFATAPHARISKTENTLTEKACRSVLVSQSEGEYGHVKIELCHPLPITVIQWRPSVNGPEFAKHSPRHVLLTCCLDGTVRLWSETENGKVRKFSKDVNNRKSTRRHFSVAAVVEINQALKGTLGMDLFVTWATEIRGMCQPFDVTKKVQSSVGFEQNKAGNCEWLISLGPGSLVTFWAVHCLDEVSPLRFPRITLWKKQELKGFEVGRHYTDGCTNLSNKFLLKKVVISRIHQSGSPSICSLIQLLPCNSLVWSLLSAHTLTDVGDASFDQKRLESLFSCSSSSQLNLSGHAGKILHVAVHPYNCEVKIAASLDSNGLLLFWSLSSISNCVLGPPTLTPTWELCGKLVTQDSCSKYTSVQWAPSILDEELILLMGHARGIDFFAVRISQSDEENTECHYLCTIPFTGHGPFENGPTNIFSILLPSDINITYKFNKFMLLGVWMKGFQALSWEITLHAYDISGTGIHCKCDIDNENRAELSILRFESAFGTKKYCVSIIPCSSQLPNSQIHDQITSFAVVHQGTFVPVQQKLSSSGEPSTPAYIMATGSADGSLKLWKSNVGKPSIFHVPWELVCVVVTHQGPITALSLTDCGRKIATISKDNLECKTSNVHLWELAYLGAGTLLFEDELSFESNIIAVDWLTLGNGQFLLGICLQNELCVYSLKRFGCHTLSETTKSLDAKTWICIGISRTLPSNCGFRWGPRTTAIVLHDRYFCIVSPWLFLGVTNPDAMCNTHYIGETKTHHVNGTTTNISAAVFADKCCGIKTLPDDIYESKYRPGSLGLISMPDVVDKLCGSLSSFHPQALLFNIYSGKWKRAYSALSHLIEHLSSDKKSSANSTYTIPEIPLSDYFEGVIKTSTDKGVQWSTNSLSSQFKEGVSQWAFNWDSISNDNSFIPSSTKSEFSSFVEPLEKLYELAGLTSMEKTQTLAIVDLLGEISNKSSSSAYESLDEPGRRYWIALRFQQLQFLRRESRSASVEELAIDSKLIGWAYHSDCQEILLNSVSSNEPTWQEMRSLGVGIWFTNTTQLRIRMEKLARSQYLKKKDPKDCMLLYVTLNRIQVLAGLFKISRDEKDKPLVGFLSRNFQEEKNKAAALKNAYVLLGKHQLELAVAFFLLGGDTSSAVSVCAKTLGDEQLALVICHLVEGRGGPLQQHLITKFMLPSAIEKGDTWLASILEWELGNYTQSFLNVLRLESNSVTGPPFLSSKHIALLDPSVGMYCRLLANKNSMKKAVGVQSAEILCQLATLMMATALNRSGLPLEALEHVSTCGSITDVSDGTNKVDIQCFDTISKICQKYPRDSSSWLSVEFAVHLEHQAKTDLAAQYFSNLIRKHPSWPTVNFESVGCMLFSKEYEMDYEKSLESYQHKLSVGFAQFEMKFSLLPASLVSMMLLFLCNLGLQFIGNDIVQGFTSQECPDDKNLTTYSFLVHRLLHKALLKTAQEISLSASRYTIACSLSFHRGEIRSKCLDTWWYYLQGLLLSLQGVRAALRSTHDSLNDDCVFKLLTILDLVEYDLYFTSAWLLRDSRCLLKMVQLLLANEQSPLDVEMERLKQLLSQFGELIAQNLLSDVDYNHEILEGVPNEEYDDIVHSIPGDERWHIIGACLWHHVSKFIRHKLTTLTNKSKEGSFSGLTLRNLNSWVPGLSTIKSDQNDILKNMIELISTNFTSLLTIVLAQASSYQLKQLVSFLQYKLDKRLCVATVVWFEQFSKSSEHKKHHADEMYNIDMCNKGEFETLWSITSNPNLVSECFAHEKVHLLHCFDRKLSKRWTDIYNGTTRPEETCGRECALINSSASDTTGSPGKLLRSGRTLVSSEKELATLDDVMPFQKPKEIYRRNGELLEALCINSVDGRQAALASNKKGIIFFSWEDGMASRDEEDYIWSNSEWPLNLNGWAGSESTPAPTCVFPGVGLGSNKGAHLGLGGATVGIGSPARPARDLTGGGAFGISGYAGMGASGLGWETQEDFEEFVDPPATAEHTSTRAFSSHPSRPLFLVGSTNTHVYLWEFGKDRATATYGVLPAANVPPPYALASISSVQFDQCGHRFATAALDGTVCSWQLEVGGRSNVCPTESSLCFNGHASDVTYVTSSGSIIAVAGYSSSAVNVVIWDTLAPPKTSQAAIMCHEGGARSISVFDNEIGSGSVSPLIVTGGKGGDVGLHDFRYVVTGRTKKHSPKGERISDASNTNMLGTVGEQNLNGMLWYIPKAHSGSVTKITSIPNTSLFLTGSKDGDVKLWDAKRAKLVHHWPKLHDRHTFLQPSSRGFGEVVRAAVTDIQVIASGFLTCGGDGLVKLVQLQ
uniref:RAVE complex protein Rav1 C-terminal domain-containing protein n=1 Tax=Cucumis melo TaxID=3656 RepID=A0A9I9CN67_CUCME